MGQGHEKEMDSTANAGTSKSNMPTGMNKHEIFFGHGVSDDRRNRFTIAILPVDATTVNVGVSVCGRYDTFNKKIGRQMAEGRARKRHTMMYTGSTVDTTTIEGMLKLKSTIKDEVACRIGEVKEKLFKIRTLGLNGAK